MLYVVTGVRGAGKTTLIDSLRRADLVTVLQPSTTRPPRFDGEDEYEFVETWDAARYAWSIQYSNGIYGMRRSEIDRALHADAITVFEPMSIEVFNEFRRREGVLSTTIGLDTVNDLTEQRERVAGSQSRLMDVEQFNVASLKVRACDAVLYGNAMEIETQITEIIRNSISNEIM